MRVAGLAPVQDIPGLENIDVTKLVNGHMAYRAAMPRLLREVGWKVESDEFTEIEDPDPENHEARQRELIRELDEARREAEAKPEKKRFGFFKRGKLAERKGWEMYDDRMRTGAAPATNNGENRQSSVLFDVDAIRAELASEHIEVKQLESTLPPMKLDLDGPVCSTEKAVKPPHLGLRATKSFDGATMSDAAVSDIRSSPSPNAEHGDGAANRASNVRDQFKGPAESIPQRTGESDIHMTFEHSYPDLPQPRVADQSRGTAGGAQPPDTPLAANSTSLQRPGLRSAVTMPTGISGLSLEHNAWAEEEEEDLGKEKEIRMTFA